MRIGEPRAQGVDTGSKEPVLGSMCITPFGLLPALSSVSLSKTVAGFASARELHVLDIGEIAVVLSSTFPWFYLTPPYHSWSFVNLFF
jgi:hypothetical protein